MKKLLVLPLFGLLIGCAHPSFHDSQENSSNNPSPLNLTAQNTGPIAPSTPLYPAMNITNCKGAKLGSLSSDGNFYNSKGQWLGTLSTDENNIIAQDGETIGHFSIKNRHFMNTAGRDEGKLSGTCHKNVISLLSEHKVKETAPSDTATARTTSNYRPTSTSYSSARASSYNTLYANNSTTIIETAPDERRHEEARPPQSEPDPVPSAGEIKNQDNQVVGDVSSTGVITNQNDQVVADVSANGVITDKNDKVIADVAPDGVVTNKDDKVIADIAPDGEIKNQDGQVIGDVAPDGVVTNKDDQVIGDVPPGDDVVGLGMIEEQKNEHR